jgi:hypothetical protein
MSENRRYRKFSAQQKIELALASLRGPKTISELCREHDISESLLRRWRERFLAAGGRRARWAAPSTAIRSAQLFACHLLHDGVGIAGGVGVNVGVGLGAGAGMLGVWVAVALGVWVGMGLGVWVGVGVALGVGVTVGVGNGVGVGVLTGGCGRGLVSNSVVPAWLSATERCSAASEMVSAVVPSTNATKPVAVASSHRGRVR